MNQFTAKNLLIAVASAILGVAISVTVFAQGKPEGSETQRAVGRAVAPNKIGLDGDALARVASKAAEVKPTAAPPKHLVLAIAANSTSLDLYNGRLNYLTQYTAEVYNLEYRGVFGSWSVFQEKSPWDWTWLVNEEGTIYVLTSGSQPVLFKFADGLMLPIVSN